MNGKLEREISPQEYNILHIAFKMHTYILGKQIAKFAFLAKNPEHSKITYNSKITDNIADNIVLYYVLCYAVILL